jgi:septum site-determining protein MinC
MKTKPGQRRTTRTFELKGSMLTVTVLQLRQWEPDLLAAQLAEKIAEAPEFFRNVPLAVDLEAVQAVSDLDFAALAALLRGHGFVPVGVRNATPEQAQAASAAGFGLLPKGKPERGPSRAAAQPAEPTPAAPPASARIIASPIRSGQRVYAQGGDLVVVGSVSAGAELLADGNIHVYGVLRGRALAGARGDTAARIFCRELEADLLSIAGHYRLIEELDPTLRDKPVQVYLEEDRLKLQAL